MLVFSRDGSFLHTRRVLISKQKLIIQSIMFVFSYDSTIYKSGALGFVCLYCVFWRFQQYSVISRRFKFTDNCTFCAMFSKSCLLQRRQKASIWGKGLILEILGNFFPDTDAFSYVCCRWLYENIVEHREISLNKQFLIFLQCYELYSINLLSFIEIIHIFCPDVFKCVFLQIIYMW